jgi:6-phosphofructokinase 1
MMTINRANAVEYSVYYDCADIGGIANGVKHVPREFINAEGNGITNECIGYLAPLILGEVYPEYENGVPKHIVL